MELGGASTGKYDTADVTLKQLTLLRTEELGQLLVIQHLGNDSVGHSAIPGARAARQLAKRLPQPSFAKVEIKRRQQ